MIITCIPVIAIAFATPHWDVIAEPVELTVAAKSDAKQACRSSMEAQVKALEIEIGKEANHIQPLFLFKYGAACQLPDGTTVTECQARLDAATSGGKWVDPDTIEGSESDDNLGNIEGKSEYDFMGAEK